MIPVETATNAIPHAKNVRMTWPTALNAMEQTDPRYRTASVSQDTTIKQAVGAPSAASPA